MPLIRDDSPDDDAEGRLVIKGKFPNVVVTWNDVDVTSQLVDLRFDIERGQFPHVSMTLHPGSVDIDTETYVSLAAYVKES